MDNLQVSTWISACTTLATCLSAIATLAIAITALRQVILVKSQVQQTGTQLRLLKTQVEQSSEHSLMAASNEQNWKLFEHWAELPAFLPAWSELKTEKQWAWRVLHFNHLNLLWLAHQEHKRGLLGKDEMKSWRDKAKHWYQRFWESNPSQDTVEGGEILKQVLRPEEGFSKEFRDWLVKETIVPPNFIPD